jgi:triphosphatase
MAEIELKFDLPPKAHAAFRRLPALSGTQGPTVRIRSTYFDTPDFELRRAEMALRLRRAGGRWVQTLKAGHSGGGGLHARDEWEVDRPGPTLDLAALAGTPFEAGGDIGGRLGEIFTVDMRRTTWDVEVSPGNRVEVVLDRGEVRHGDRSEALSEVEIESI